MVSQGEAPRSDIAIMAIDGTGKLLLTDESTTNSLGLRRDFGLHAPAWSPKRFGAWVRNCYEEANENSYEIHVEKTENLWYINVKVALIKRQSAATSDVNPSLISTTSISTSASPLPPCRS
jgi:hypothetical protein